MISSRRVIEKNYLLKVLALAGIPRMMTLGLTWLSFPLMLRALGPEKFGTLVFIGAALTVFETLMDFGISSASGKAMAQVRSLTPWAIRDEFLAWVRLQLLMVAIGFGPMLLGAYLMIRDSPQFQDMIILWIVAASVFFSVGFNFLRSNLQSLLSFKFLALLETTDSVSRSLGYLVVAFGFPSVLGLALAGLFTAATSTMLATGLTMLEIGRYRTRNQSGDLSPDYLSTRWTVRLRLTESLSFLWLRLASRLFSETPNLLLGRCYGAELVGIVAGARKLIDLLATPYLTIGNALMVRVHDVAKQGRFAVRQLMEQVTNIAVSSVFLLAVCWNLLPLLSHWLFPENAGATKIFALLLFLIPALSINALYATLSDYYGGLRRRNLFLSVMAIFQIGGLWAASQWGSAYGAVLTVVGCYGVLAGGYALIAHRVLIGDFKLSLPKEARNFIMINVLGLTSSALVVWAISYLPSSIEKLSAILPLAIFLMVTLGILASRDNLRRCFLQFGFLHS